MINKEVSIVLECNCRACTECEYGGPIIERINGQDYNNCILQASKRWVFWKDKDGNIKTFSKDCLSLEVEK